jgi:2-haloacid dehalogenase
LPRMNADGIHRLTLDTVGDRFPQLALTDDEKDDLTDVWHSLDAWPDANPAIQRLRSKYTVVVLTVLSFGIAVESSKHSGIDWDAIISCEFLEHYKPDVDAYLDGLDLLGIEPREAMMVAAHKWDLMAAKEAGLATAYVPRPQERGEHTQSEPALDGVDVNAPDFAGLADLLGA